jgi:LIVCS family branched-chain amino acid:cation transporter
MTSIVLSITSVNKIITFAYPILSLVYPIAITLLLYTIFFGSIVKNRRPNIVAWLASTAIAVFHLLKHYALLNVRGITILNHVPIFAYELDCVIPSAFSFSRASLIKVSNREKEFNTNLKRTFTKTLDGTCFLSLKRRNHHPTLPKVFDEILIAHHIQLQ